MDNKTLVDFASKFLDKDLTEHELFNHPIMAPNNMMKAKLRLKSIGANEAGIPKTYEEFWAAVKEGLDGY